MRDTKIRLSAQIQVPQDRPAVKLPKLKIVNNIFKVTILIKNLYDDFIGGEKSVSKAFELFKKLRIRFLEGHFLLRKWKTNNLELQNLSTHNNSGNEDTVRGAL